MPCGTRRPLILITVCRRYLELMRAVEAIWKAYERGEFAVRPEVWVVWARPEVGRSWVMRRLVKQERVGRVIPRYELPGESDTSATTYPESVNLRLGLEAARDAYGDSVYVIGQAADVLPLPGSYRFIDERLNDGETNAVLFHWENGCSSRDVWHTNFFAVSTDEAYWPPISTPDHADTLERQWGVAIATTRPPGVFKSSNYASKKFRHEHLSESITPLPLLHDYSNDSISFYSVGYLSWRNRCMSLLKGALPWHWFRSSSTRPPKR